jgi:hypothetical protein
LIIDSHDLLPLPPGITGFGVTDVKVDFKSFLTSAYETGRIVGGKVIETSRPVDPGRSFHEIGIEIDSRSIRILCNAQYPVIAFAEITWQGDTTIAFVDEPKLAVVFQRRYLVLSKDIACTDIKPMMIENLLPVELEQARYWKPERLGAIIFNHWD